MLHNTFYYGVVHTEGSSNGDKEKCSKEQERINEAQKKVYQLGYKRGMIKAYLDAGYGYLEIANKMGIPGSSVRSLAAKLEKYDSLI